MLDNPGSAQGKQGGADDKFTVSPPTGGGAIRGIGEKFAANPVTGIAKLFRG